MNNPAGFRLHVPTVRIRVFMVLAWVAIVTKCVLVAWAVEHWRMPFHAAWVIGPTLAFAALATVVWLGQHEE